MYAYCMNLRFNCHLIHMNVVVEFMENQASEQFQQIEKNSYT